MEGVVGNNAVAVPPAALRVAVTGANHMKCAFAGLDPKSVAYLGQDFIRTRFGAVTSDMIARLVPADA